MCEGLQARKGVISSRQSEFFSHGMSEFSRDKNGGDRIQGQSRRPLTTNNGPMRVSHPHPPITPRLQKMKNPSQITCSRDSRDHRGSIIARPLIKHTDATSTHTLKCLAPQGRNRSGSGACTEGEHSNRHNTISEVEPIHQGGSASHPAARLQLATGCDGVDEIAKNTVDCKRRDALLDLR